MAGKSVIQQFVDVFKDASMDTQNENYKTQHEQKQDYKANGGSLGDFQEAGQARSLNWGNDGSVKNFKNHNFELIRDLKEDNPNFKNLQQLPKMAEHIKDHLNEKLETCSYGYVNNIASNVNKFSDMCGAKFGMEEQFGKIREVVAEWRAECRAEGYTKDMNLEPRSYSDCISIGENFSNDKHAVAWDVMHEGGARINCEANGRGDGIQADQMKGIQLDRFGEEKGVIHVIGKGGRERDIYVSPQTYNAVERYIQQEGAFKFDPHSFRDDLKEACKLAGYESESNGPHGARHSFAKNYMAKCLDSGMDYRSALKCTSLAMGHSRESITLIYLR